MRYERDISGLDMNITERGHGEMRVRPVLSSKCVATCEIPTAVGGRDGSPAFGHCLISINGRSSFYSTIPFNSPSSSPYFISVRSVILFFVLRFFKLVGI